eukprot:gnl/TRDRNA2_/TRDRNA2_200482_c0_seq1.p1 gnl/TRDRNA2_/TRDRNA2_200482_c0~~gnl/TRDRNA2_/TRDRNA2_200482_c0_seq1.p1  ORF type:complete len:267 (+),score=27.33 gnl/TRDRNA2_/TRDRNA2_200482_c0_seq1:69-869(+)
MVRVVLVVGLAFIINACLIAGDKHRSDDSMESVWDDIFVDDKTPAPITSMNDLKEEADRNKRLLVDLTLPPDPSWSPLPSSRPLRPARLDFVYPDGTRVYHFPDHLMNRRIHPTDPEYGTGKLYDGDSPPYFRPKEWDDTKTVPRVDEPLAITSGEPFKWAILRDGTNIWYYHVEGKEGQMHILPDAQHIWLPPEGSEVPGGGALVIEESANSVDNTVDLIQTSLDTSHMPTAMVLSRFTGGMLVAAVCLCNSRRWNMGHKPLLTA